MNKIGGVIFLSMSTVGDLKKGWDDVYFGIKVSTYLIVEHHQQADSTWV